MPTVFDRSNNQGAKDPSRNVGPSWTSRSAQMFAFQNVSALYLLVLVEKTDKIDKKINKKVHIKPL
jgi:hypothetical protein